LISFGSAAITSFFVSPFNTGIKNLTSETRVWYKSRTRATNSALGGAVNNTLYSVLVNINNTLKKDYENVKSENQYNRTSNIYNENFITVMKTVCHQFL
jgi:hypothetical protein